MPNHIIYSMKFIKTFIRPIYLYAKLLVFSIQKPSKNRVAKHKMTVSPQNIRT